MTDSPQEVAWFRWLYHEIYDYRGESLYDDVLVGWIDRTRHALNDCSSFQTFAPYNRKDETSQDRMWNLYALSRVNDVLLRCMQEDVPAEPPIPRISPADYADFYTRCGLRLFESDTFTPFYHEIVRVHPSPDDQEPIGILGHVWPGLMFGEMLLSRSGVEVLGGRAHIVPEIAERSTLYFAYERTNRKTCDLSMGWGSNSQWRTSFRRDYDSNGIRIYNADGRHMLGGPATEEDRDGLTVEERLELCRHRCFVTSPKPDSDLWPYDDRFDEAVSSS